MTRQECWICIVLGLALAFHALYVSAAELSHFGCQQYALFMGEVGKARDEHRHRSQMVQVIEAEVSERSPRHVHEIAAFVIRDIDRVYDRPEGGEEVSVALAECVSKEGDLSRMWERQ